MNREKLQNLASEWVRIAKNDIRNKVMEFMREVNTNPRELAYALAISEGELEQILNGNGEMLMETFAKILIATGNVLEIKPIEETPIGNYENTPNESRKPRANIFEQQRQPRNVPPRFTRPLNEEFDHMPPPPPDFEEFRKMMDERLGRTEAPKPHQKQPRDARGRFASTATTCTQRAVEEQPTTPFDNMTRDELADVIVEKLWDSEIDLANASKKELVDFLVEKDKRIKEIRQVRELENDPKVIEFKERLKKTLEENPHLREWTKKFVS